MSNFRFVPHSGFNVLLINLGVSKRVFIWIKRGTIRNLKKLNYCAYFYQ